MPVRFRELQWCAPLRLTAALYASLNGFSSRTPAIVAPCCMSSVSTCWQPLAASSLHDQCGVERYAVQHMQVEGAGNQVG